MGNARRQSEIYKTKARLERFEQLKAMDSPKTAKQVEMGSVGTRLGKKTIEVYDISKAYGDKVLLNIFLIYLNALKELDLLVITDVVSLL